MGEGIERHPPFRADGHQIKVVHFDPYRPVHVRVYADTAARSSDRPAVLQLAHQQKLGRPARVGMDRAGRSTQIRPYRRHTAACSYRPSTAHFSISTVVPLNTSPKSVVAPVRPDHFGRFHVTSKMLKRQMFGRAGFELLRKRVLLYT
ncbi:hypothetical protein [Streptomyces sp. RerS4]|uniref:hypothetical protein n=1 Tax=Streptomyces sp. RerS4 TaxID=2942449 RepID=UPI00201C6E1B|nr:hypothetical protein [Streptomyces sp. RerS4]UQW99313.1 hypothetical protein M4D82_01315 [Streptomyces sp. RerS4]